VRTVLLLFGGGLSLGLLLLLGGSVDRLDCSFEELSLVDQVLHELSDEDVCTGVELLGEVFSTGFDA
jgi:hypothetical protein